MLLPMKNKIIKVLSVAGVILTGSYGFCEENDQGDEVEAPGSFSYSGKTAYSETLYYVHKLIDEIIKKLEQNQENITKEKEQLAKIDDAAFKCLTAIDRALKDAPKHSNGYQEGNAITALKLIQEKQRKAACGMDRETALFWASEMRAICGDVRGCLEALLGGDE